MEDFFRGVEQRPVMAWPAGREDLHWHVLPAPEVAEKQLVAPYRPLWEGQPGLAPVPPSWLHLTVLHGGPMGEYRDGEIDAMVKRAAAACREIEPFDITLDRPAIGRVAVECAGRPGAPARQLWELTGAADAAVTGSRFPRVPAVYYPHTTLAYGIAGEQRPDRAAMKAMLSDLPGEPVTIRAARLSLVAQSHDRRHITWRLLEEVPLGS